MRTVAFCEIDPYCSAILAERWPGIPNYGDITKFHGSKFAGFVELICGGFPCQDISAAGAGAGLGGSRSGLWSEFRRLIGEIRPRYVIVENVSALLFRGLGEVLGDLATLGYDAEWHCIPASAVGAPHRRDRVWIVAHASRERLERWLTSGYKKQEVTERFLSAGSGESESVPNTDGDYLWKQQGRWQRSSGQDTTESYADGGEKHVADPTFNGWEPWWARDATQESQWRQPNRSGVDGPLSDAHGIRGLQCWGKQFAEDCEAQRDLCQWEPEPDVGRVADGVSARVDRLKGLGNAVVPQIPYIIGRAIMRSQSQSEGGK